MLKISLNSDEAVASLASPVPPPPKKKKPLDMTNCALLTVEKMPFSYLKILRLNFLHKECKILLPKENTT